MAMDEFKVTGDYRIVVHSGGEGGKRRSCRDIERSARRASRCGPPDFDYDTF